MENELDKLAEALLNAENPSDLDPSYYPGTRKQLSDLWPVDQEKYRRMALEMIRLGAQSTSR